MQDEQTGSLISRARSSECKFCSVFPGSCVLLCESDYFFFPMFSLENRKLKHLSSFIFLKSEAEAVEGCFHKGQKKPS